MNFKTRLTIRPVFIIGFFLPQLLLADDSQSLMRANELMSAGKRIEAIRLLEQQANKLQGHTSIYLSRASSFSEQFIKEDAQKFFELGMAKPSRGESQRGVLLEKSLELEPTNIRTLNALADFEIQKKGCSKALSWTQKALEVYAWSESARVFHWQALDCLGRIREVFEQLAVTEEKESFHNKENPFLRVFTARWLIQRGLTLQGQKVLEKVAKERSNVPEVWYWMWKLVPSQGGIHMPYGRKYLSLCQNISPRLNQSLQRMGAICWHTKQVIIPDNEE